MVGRLLLSVLLSGITGLLPAQSHVIKGRAMALPGNLKAGLLAVGYEQAFNNRCAMQLLFSHTILDASATDGGRDVFTTLTPEWKYYFRPLEALHNAGYLAGFLEFRRHTSKGSGFDATISRSSEDYGIAPGVVIGRNMRFSKKWYLEVYTGPSLRLGYEINRWADPGLAYEETVRFARLGWRFGINLAFRF